MSESALQLNEAKPIPQGWRWIRLDEVCEEAATYDPGLSPDSTFHYIDISSIDATHKQIVDTHTILGKEAPSRARQMVKTNDVLVATTRPNLNAVALVPAELDSEICSTGLCVLRPASVIDPLFLFFFVQTRDFVRLLSGEVRGMLYPAVTDNQVRSISIPLPLVPEQKRIATKVQELMSEVEHARTACQAQFEAARALPSAYLRQVFESEEAKRWERRRLGEICKVVTGNTPSKNIPEYYGNDLPWVKPDELGKEMYVTDTSERLSVLGANQARVLPNGTVMVSCIGNLGKVGIAGCELATNQQINSLVPGNNVYSEFLYFWCCTIRSTLEKLAASTTLKIVNKSSFAAITIPVPDLRTQQQIAHELKDKINYAEKLKLAIEKQLEAINAFPQAILRKAFRGEL